MKLETQEKQKCLSKNDHQIIFPLTKNDSRRFNQKIKDLRGDEK